MEFNNIEIYKAMTALLEKCNTEKECDWVQEMIEEALYECVENRLEEIK